MCDRGSQLNHAHKFHNYSTKNVWPLGQSRQDFSKFPKICTLGARGSIFVMQCPSAFSKGVAIFMILAEIILGYPLIQQH